MKRWIDFLQANRNLNFLLALLYFVLVVAPHKRFGTFLNKTIVGGLGIDNNTAEGRQEYNLYAISIAVILLVTLLYFFIRNSRKLPDRKKIWGFMMLNVIMAILIVESLFVVDIEFIHFPQYAFFALLTFHLIGNYRSTLVWATLAGMVDEAYQYFYLAPKDTSHYDFNDVLTNLVGAVFGLLFLRSMNIKERSVFNLRKATFWFGIIAIFVLVCTFHMTDVLSIYPSDAHDYHILRKMPTAFWTKIHPNVTYHIVRPIEGILMTIGLWFLYSMIAPKQPIDG